MKSQTLLKITEIIFSAHFRSPHVCLNNIGICFFVSRYNDRSGTSFFDIHPVISFLSVKNKTGFLKDTIQNFPVNRCYARHRSDVSDRRCNGILMYLLRSFVSRRESDTDLNPHSFNTVSKVPLSIQEVKNRQSVSLRFFSACSSVSP